MKIETKILVFVTSFISIICSVLDLINNGFWVEVNSLVHTSSGHHITSYSEFNYVPIVLIFLGIIGLLISIFVRIKE